MAKKSKGVPDISAAPADIQEVARQIEVILNKNGLGMQAVLQIFKKPVESPLIAMGDSKGGKIVVPGGEGDIPDHVKEMLKPIGDSF